MEIIKAKYSSEDNNWVTLFFSDGSTGQCSVKDGIRRQYTDLLNEWLDKGNTIEPQYTAKELADMKRAQDIAEAKVYLNSTDWYYVRKIEENIDVPIDVVNKRKVAKDLLRGV